MENTKSTAYAFMIMLAGLAVIAHYGRASAEVAPPAAYESQMPAGYGPMQRPAGYAPQYGLIQTGVVGVAQMDGNGDFGRPAAMPVFQVVQLQPTMAQAQAGYEAQPHAMQMPQGAPQAPAAAAEPMIPQGMSVTPPAAQMAGALCDIKGVRVLTQSAEACAMAGGQTATP
jgi:hypothetical protein